MPLPQLSPAQSTYLDFIRALAAFGVMFGHGAILFMQDSGVGFWEIQSVGVILFFFLSGFLISHSVFQKLRNPDYGFGHYLTDRASRIYAAYLPALLFIAALDMATIYYLNQQPPSYRDVALVTQSVEPNHSFINFVGNIFMLQDYPAFQVLRVAGIDETPLFIDTFGSGNVFWSISVEWWLYMAFGWAVYAFAKNTDLFRLTGYSRGKSAMSLPLRLGILGFFSVVPLYFMTGGNLNCLGLVWIGGVIVSALFNVMPYLKSRAIIPPGMDWVKLCFYGALFSLFLFVVRTVAILLDEPKIDFGELQASLFIGAALFLGMFALQGKHDVPPMIRKSCKFVAEYSFSLYLTHYSIMTFLYAAFPGHGNDPVFMLGTFVITNVFAIAFWWAFERHYKTLATIIKARIFHKRPTADEVIPGRDVAQHPSPNKDQRKIA